MLLVYTIGGISGSHVNPAVTVGLWSIGKMRMQEAMTYLVAQVLGAVAAQLIFQAFTGSFPSVDVTDKMGWATTVAEAIGAFILVFGVSAAVHEKTHKAANGLTIGVALLLGILLAMPTSVGIVNPAVSMGLRVYPAAYLVGPLIGGILAAHFYQWLSKTEA